MVRTTTPLSSTGSFKEERRKGLSAAWVVTANRANPFNGINGMIVEVAPGTGRETVGQGRIIYNCEKYTNTYDYEKDVYV